MIRRACAGTGGWSRLRVAGASPESLTEDSGSERVCFMQRSPLRATPLGWSYCYGCFAEVARRELRRVKGFVLCRIVSFGRLRLFDQRYCMCLAGVAYRELRRVKDLFYDTVVFGQMWQYGSGLYFLSRWEQFPDGFPETIFS